MTFATYDLDAYAAVHELSVRDDVHAGAVDEHGARGTERRERRAEAADERVGVGLDVRALRALRGVEAPREHEAASERHAWQEPHDHDERRDRGEEGEAYAADRGRDRRCRRACADQA